MAAGRAAKLQGMACRSRVHEARPRLPNPGHHVATTCPPPQVTIKGELETATLTVSAKVLPAPPPPAAPPPVAEGEAEGRADGELAGAGAAC